MRIISGVLNFLNHVVINGDVTKEQAAIYYKGGWDGLINNTT